MKRILVLITALFVTAGCTTTAYFDNNEYATLVQLEVMSRATHQSCPVPSRVMQSLSHMMYEAEYFYTYTKYRTKNNETHQIASIILENIKELGSRYQGDVPSTVYCQQKTDLLTKTIQTGLEGVQSKVKR